MRNELSHVTIIGENLHTSRVLSRTSKRVMVRDGRGECIEFRDVTGQRRYLTVPESYRTTKAYQQGQIQHILMAVHKGLWGTSAEQDEGRAYIQYETRRQIEAGADLLDLNVDELSPSLDAQRAAMRWLVETVQEVATVSLSIDSSRTAILHEGLLAYKRQEGRPLLNSATLERVEVLDLARAYDTEVVVTAWGHGVMPRDDKERVAHIGELLSHAGGIALERLHVDPLILPIGIDTRSGSHYLDAVRTVRAVYGPTIHITGGLSNVSFGLPYRRLINETFTVLAMEAGIDEGMMDPVQMGTWGDMLARDRTAEPYRLARAMLLGEDEGCSAYREACRAGHYIQKDSTPGTGLA